MVEALEAVGTLDEYTSTLDIEQEGRQSTALRSIKPDKNAEKRSWISQFRVSNRRIPNTRPLDSRENQQAP